MTFANDTNFFLTKHYD